jgi:hypothetical protein
MRAPALTVVGLMTLLDELAYEWQTERWQLRGGVMVFVQCDAGTARHADLPVPKHQGDDCGP